MNSARVMQPSFREAAEGMAPVPQADFFPSNSIGPTKPPPSPNAATASLTQRACYRDQSHFKRKGCFGVRRKPKGEMLRGFAPTNESGHEHGEGNANTKPDSEQSEDIRTAKPRKARVIDAIQERRNTHCQNDEGGKLRPLLARARFGVHGR